MRTMPCDKCWNKSICKVPSIWREGTQSAAGRRGWSSGEPENRMTAQRRRSALENGRVSKAQKERKGTSGERNSMNNGTEV